MKKFQRSKIVKANFLKAKIDNTQLYGNSKRQTGEISHEKNLTWLRKVDLKSETEPLLIAAQNNTLRTNCIKEE